MKNPMDGLKKIAELGKKERNVVIAETKIVLKSLSAREENNIFSACQDLDGIFYINANKIQTLACSIIEISGARFETDNEETLKEKVTVIESWGQSVVDYLFTEYSVLIKEIEESFKEIIVEIKE